MNRSRLSLCALALTVPLMIAGCGGSSSDASSSAADESGISAEDREVARAGLADGISRLDALTESEKGCMNDWADTLAGADLAQWLIEPVPQDAKDGLVNAQVTCQRDGTTVAALEGLAAQGLTESMVACARQYLGGLSLPDFGALTVDGGQPEAVQAYSDAFGACRAAG